MVPHEAPGTVCVLPRSTATAHPEVHPGAGHTGPPTPDDWHPLTPLCHQQGMY